MKAEQTGKREAGGWLVPSPESQRRSGDITGSRAAVEIYGWQVSDKPFSIKIPLDIVDRLQRDIQYGLGMTTSCDVMGLLIGRIATEYSSTLIIQDYVLTGYTSDNDSPERWSDERLAEMGRPFTRLASPFFVVGFFRSQHGDWPEVEKEDFKGAKRLLRSTPNVFLLIRTGFSRGFSGRLFLRPSRRAKFKDEYGEFPLDADILRAQCEATAPKREHPPLHFVPGNPLQGRPRPDLAAPAPLEASFARVPEQPVQPSAETPSITLAERLRSKFFRPSPWAKPFPPATEQGLDLPLEPPKQGLWAKMFPTAQEQEDPRIEPAVTADAESPRPFVKETAPLVQPAAAASVESASLPVKPPRHVREEKAPPVQPAAAASVESPSLSVKPSRPVRQEKTPLAQPAAAASSEPIAPPSVWAKPLRPATGEKVPHIEPVTAASSESASLFAKPSSPAVEEKVPLGEPVAANAESSGSPSLWAKLLRRAAAEEKAPVVESIAVASSESPSLANPARPAAEEKVLIESVTVASSELIAPPSRWRRLFRPAATEEKSRLIEPVVAASAESIALDVSPEPSKPSLWAKAAAASADFFRPAATEEKSPLIDPVVAASAESIAPDVSPEPSKPSLWAKAVEASANLFGPAAEEVPVVEPVTAASSELPSLFAKPSVAVAEEKASLVEPVAAASTESLTPPSRWARLFRPATEEKSPVIEPAAAARAGSIAPDISPEPKPNLWAKAAAASADFFRPTSTEEAPVVEPVAAASSETIESPSWWARLFRSAPAEEETPIVQPIAAAAARPIAPDIFRAAPEPSLSERIAASRAVAFATQTPLSTLPWNRWLSIAATWIIAVGGTMWFMHGRSSLRVQQPEVSETRSAILSNLIGLHVDNSGRLLNISWDRASSIAMNSKAGFLIIRDGSLVSEVRLDSTEVRTGHLYYRPRSEDLGIRLEVTEDDGGIASESVRVLGPLASNR